jgi:hypothetical protein
VCPLPYRGRDTPLAKLVLHSFCQGEQVVNSKIIDNDAALDGAHPASELRDLPALSQVHVHDLAQSLFSPGHPRCSPELFWDILQAGLFDAR